MEKTTQAKTRSAVSFVLDNATTGVFAKSGKGTWDVSLYFSLRNRTRTPIRITNINANLDFRFLGSGAALTIGSRESVDLRTKNALLLDNKYFDLVPGEEQPICGKLEIVRWFRIPSSRVERDYALFFSLSVEYRMAATEETCVVVIPVFYYVNSRPVAGRPHGLLSCITDHNVDDLIAANRTNEAFSEILRRVKGRLEAESAQADVIWGDGRSESLTHAMPIAIKASTGIGD